MMTLKGLARHTGYPGADGCGGRKECHHDAEREKPKNIVNPEVFESSEYWRRAS
jgi:hypothetical protein